MDHGVWVSTPPDKAGKYIVETRTLFGRTNVMLSYYNGKSWSFTNQRFHRYLKERTRLT